jgi:hypothetical protein
MRESIFQTEFLKWIKYQSKLKTAVFELKLTKGISLPFDAVLPHQLDSLLNAKHRKLGYKIPDDSVGYKPFDSFVVSKVPAYIVVRFYKRGDKKFYMIDVDDWVLESEKSKRKSITEERAAEIGLTCLLNKENGCTRGTAEN